jgi:hypothetical protein
MLEAGFNEVHQDLQWNGWLLQHKPMRTQPLPLTETGPGLTT